MIIHTPLERLEALDAFRRDYNNVLKENPVIEQKIDLLLDGIALIAQIMMEELTEKEISKPNPQ